MAERTKLIFEMINLDDDYIVDPNSIFINGWLPNWQMLDEFLLNNTQDLKEYKNVNDFPIWNTSEKVDKWLIKNCEIQSFRDRMLEVYSHKWVGFKGQKWIPKPRLKPKCRK